jgi:hypothetical protein
MWEKMRGAKFEERIGINSSGKTGFISRTITKRFGSMIGPNYRRSEAY